jgi:hypothetical protein
MNKKEEFLRVFREIYPEQTGFTSEYKEFKKALPDIADCDPENYEYQQSDDLFDYSDVYNFFCKGMEAARPKWKPIDEKCKDGGCYLFRHKSESSFAFTSSFCDKPHEFTIGALSNLEDYEYMEIPD